MNYRAVTTVTLRLTGVAVLISTLSHSPVLFATLFRRGASSAREALLVMAMAEVVPLLVGLALIYFPARLTSLVVGTASEEGADDQIEGLGQVAAIALGIYFFASGFFDLVYYFSKYWVYRLQMPKDEWSDPVPIYPHDVAGAVSAVVQLIAGSILALKARTLYRWIRRIRETRPKSDN